MESLKNVTKKIFKRNKNNTPVPGSSLKIYKSKKMDIKKIAHYGH